MDARKQLTQVTGLMSHLMSEDTYDANTNDEWS